MHLNLTPGNKLIHELAIFINEIVNLNKATKKKGKPNWFMTGIWTLDSQTNETDEERFKEKKRALSSISWATERREIGYGMTCSARAYEIKIFRKFLTRSYMVNILFSIQKREEGKCIFYHLSVRPLSDIWSFFNDFIFSGI